MRDGLEIMRGLGVADDDVRAVGGGARSPLWMQLQADVYGRAVRRTVIDEGPAYGAALLGGVAAGVFADVGEASERVRLRDEVTEPDAERAPPLRRAVRDLHVAVSGAARRDARARRMTCARGATVVAALLCAALRRRALSPCRRGPAEPRRARRRAGGARLRPRPRRHGRLRGRRARRQAARAQRQPLVLLGERREGDAGARGRPRGAPPLPHVDRAGAAAPDDHGVRQRRRRARSTGASAAPGCTASRARRT